MGAKKSTPKAKKSSGVLGKVKSAIGAKLGIKAKGGGGRRRSHGPEWYARKILVLKLKKRLYKLKYGGR
jgi:hypothetical protein